MRVFVLAILLVASAAFGALRADAASEPDTFEASEAAYIALDFDGALAGYKTAGDNQALSAKERARAYRQLGVVTWRIKGDDEAADKSFSAALAIGAELSATHVERARMLCALGRYSEAIVAANAAISFATSEAETRSATLAYARSVLASLGSKNIADQSAEDRRLLSSARERLLTYVDDTPVPLELSEAMLGVGLRLGDGSLALTGWQSYAREGAEKGAWAEAGERLARAFGRWTDDPVPEWRTEIFEGLRTTQFFDLAALVASDTRFSDAADFVKIPRVRETLAYAKAIKKIRDATDDYYRDLANKTADNKAWHAMITAAGQELWPSLELSDGSQPFNEETLAKELRARFGAYINIGKTGDVEDLHYGHVFIDDAREIEQYGHSASVRLVSLDRLVSNGYESWVWDQRQEHGGWAEADRIIIVRPGYADAALRIWSNLTDPLWHAEIEEKIKTLALSDEELATKDDGAYLAGLTARLEWRGDNAILERLRAKGFSASNLKREFIIALTRIKLDASIFAHEGRHVLDKIAFKETLSSEEMEFRAKLSEVAFCEEPLICFDSIFNANMGDATSPHGRANKRVAIGIVAWMKAHQDDIVGLDSRRPMLPQFDLLTAEQMRAAMRSMDPWAPKAAD